MEEKVVYKGKECEVKFLHEAKNGLRGELSVAYIDIEYGQLIAVAERSPKDRYDAEMAKTVLLGRLRKKIKKISGKEN